jgi:hypothetical protein
MNKAFLLLGFVALAGQTANADIGSTMRDSQREYGSRGSYANAENSAVTWHYRNWIITEYYSPSGNCNSVVYQTAFGGFFNPSDISTILHANIPPGVAWRETSNPAAWGMRHWVSTDYTVNGYVFSLAADWICVDGSSNNGVADANGSLGTTRQRFTVSVQ